MSASQLVLDLLVNGARDVNRARLGKALETRGNIDAIAVNVGCFDDDVARIAANPILDPMMPGQRCVASNHVLLNDDGTPHGFDRTVENRNEAVACGFDQPSMVLCDAGFDQAALDPLYAAVRSFFIDFHQAAVARDIAGDNRGNTSRPCLPPRLPPLVQFQIPISAPPLSRLL